MGNQESVQEQQDRANMPGGDEEWNQDNPNMNTNQQSNSSRPSLASNNSGSLKGLYASTNTLPVPLPSNNNIDAGGARDSESSLHKYRPQSTSKNAGISTSTHSLHNVSSTKLAEWEKPEQESILTLLPPEYHVEDEKPAEEEAKIEIEPSVSAIEVESESPDSVSTKATNSGSARKIINNFLFQIGVDYNSDWRLNDQGLWPFTFGEYTIVIEVPANNDVFFIYTALPGMGENEQYVSAKNKYANHLTGGNLRKMLGLNYLSLKTRGGCLSYQQRSDDDKTQIEATFHFSGYCSELQGRQEFELILSNFIDTSHKLHREILGTDTLKQGFLARCCAKCGPGQENLTLADKPPCMNENEVHPSQNFQTNCNLINSFLSEISKSVGKNLVLNSDGICAFLYEKFTIVIEVARNSSVNDHFYMYSTLVGINADASSPEVLMKALQLNYLGQVTRGGVISIDPASDDLLYHYRDRCNNINSAEFRNILENFIDNTLKVYTEFDGEKIYSSVETNQADFKLPNLNSLVQEKTKLFELLNHPWWKVNRGNAQVDWEGVIQCLEESPEDAKQQYEYKTSYGKEKVYPIHKALGLCAPYDVVLAFHKHWPECLSLENEAGCIPLHYGVEQSSLKVVEFLVRQYPEGVKKGTTEGITPMHTAAMNSASLDVMKVLISAVPTACELIDGEGKLPLHCLAERKQMSCDVMSYLIKQFPAACGMMDKQGFYPIHHAAWAQTQVSVIQALVDCSPDTLMARDKILQTPLHVASRSKVTSLEIVKYLIEEGPEALNAESKNGIKPLQAACYERKPRGEMVLFLAEHNSNEDVKKAELDGRFDIITSLIDAPEEDVEYISSTQTFQNILNKKMMHPFIPAIILAELFSLGFAIFHYHYLIKDAINKSIDDDNNYEKPDFFKWNITGLIIAVVWFTLQEVAQFLGSRKLARSEDYIWNVWNWIDIINILLLLMFLITVLSGTGSAQYFRRLDFAVELCLYLKCVSFLKALQIGFAVFVGGLFNVFRRLLSFTVVLAIFLWMYSHILHIAFYKSDVCFEAETPAFCDGDSLFFTIYAFLLGDFDAAEFKSPYSQFVFFIFTFASIVVFLNVLIGIVTKSYDAVATSEAEVRFWINRAKYIAEVDAILTLSRPTQEMSSKKRKTNCWRSFEKQKEKFWDWWFLGVYGTPVELDGTLETYGVWISYKDLWPLKDGKASMRLVRLYCLGFVGIIIIPIWIALGLFFGILWPSQLKRRLFITFAAGDIRKKERNPRLFASTSLSKKKKKYKNTVIDSVANLEHRVKVLEERNQEILADNKKILKKHDEMMQLLKERLQ